MTSTKNKLPIGIEDFREIRTEGFFYIRNLFEQALKTNTSLQFSVLTGCMRIS